MAIVDNDNGDDGHYNCHFFYLSINKKIIVDVYHY